jgi:hypothetical protein
MVGQYDKIFEQMRPVIQETLKKPEGTTGIPLETTLIASKIPPEDKDIFIEELRKYFHKLGITAYEAESFSGEKIIKFEEGLDEREEKYKKFLDVYKSLGKIFDKYLSDNHEGFTIDQEDLVGYVNKRKHIIEIDDLYFLDGLQWYLSSRVGINMRLSPLLSMKTDDTKGLTLVFET